MTKTSKVDRSEAKAGELNTAEQRRVLLKKLGRFAAVSAPAVTLLLAAKAKPSAAQGCVPVKSSSAFKIRLGPVDGAAVLAAVANLPIRAQ